MNDSGMVDPFAPSTPDYGALQPHVRVDVMPAYPTSFHSFICAESAEHGLLADACDLGNSFDNLVNLFLFGFSFHIS